MVNGLALMPEQNILQAAWIVTLPDHEATERFAKILAEELKPGDLVTLSGGSARARRRWHAPSSARSRAIRSSRFQAPPSP